jgi:hypothetical protein
MQNVDLSARVGGFALEAPQLPACGEKQDAAQDNEDTA